MLTIKDQEILLKRNDIEPPAKNRREKEAAYSERLIQVNYINDRKKT
jgi:hypothetical protein